MELEATVQQFRSKLSYFQEQIERYEYQISCREQEIKEIWETIH